MTNFDTCDRGNDQLLNWAIDLIVERRKNFRADDARSFNAYCREFHTLRNFQDPIKRASEQQIRSALLELSSRGLSFFSRTLDLGACLVRTPVQKYILSIIDDLQSQDKLANHSVNLNILTSCDGCLLSRLAQSDETLFDSREVTFFSHVIASKHSDLFSSLRTREHTIDPNQGSRLPDSTITERFVEIIALFGEIERDSRNAFNLSSWETLLSDSTSFLERLRNEINDSANRLIDHKKQYETNKLAELRDLLSHIQLLHRDHFGDWGAGAISDWSVAPHMTVSYDSINQSLVSLLSASDALYAAFTAPISMDLHQRRLHREIEIRSESDFNAAYQYASTFFVANTSRTPLPDPKLNTESADSLHEPDRPSNELEPSTEPLATASPTRAAAPESSPIDHPASLRNEPEPSSEPPATASATRAAEPNPNTSDLIAAPTRTAQPLLTARTSPLSQLTQLPYKDADQPQSLLTKPSDTFHTDSDLSQWELEEDDIHISLWDALSHGDYAAVYWLVKLAPNHQGSLPFTETDAQIAFAAQFTHSSGITLKDHELFSILDNRTLNAHPLGTMMRVAAALDLSRTTPSVALGHWLNSCPTPFRGVQTVADAIRAYLERTGQGLAETSWHLNTDLMPPHHRSVSRHRPDELARAVQEWRQQTVNRQLRFGTDVLPALLDPNEQFGALVATAEADNRGLAPEVGKRVVALSDRNTLVEVIHRVQITHARTSRVQLIQYRALDQLIRHLMNGLAIIAQWSASCRRHSHQDPDPAWINNHQSVLLDSLRESLAATRSLVIQLQDSPNKAVAFAAASTRHSLEQVGKLVGLIPDSEVSTLTHKVRPVFISSKGFSMALASRLLECEGVAIDDELGSDGELMPLLAIHDTSQEDLRIALRESYQQTDPAKVLQRLASTGDFRWTEHVLSVIKDNDDRQILSEEIRQQRDRQLEELTRWARKTELLVEEAVVEGSILDDQRAEYLQKIEYIRTATHNLGAANKLSQIVTQQISNDRKRIVADRRQLWEPLKDWLATTYHSEPISSITEQVENAFSRNDIYVADDLIGRLKQAKEVGTSWLELRSSVLGDEINTQSSVWRREQRAVEDQAITPDERSRISNLFETSLSLDRLVVEFKRSSSSQRDVWELMPRNTASPRFTEAASAFEHWLALKRCAHDPQSLPQHVTSLESILTYVGFTLPVNHSTTTQCVHIALGWAYVRTAISAGTSAPVPQFGSARDGVYDIVIVWDRPNPERLNRILTEAGLALGAPFILLYLNRLVVPQWNQYVAYSQRAQLSALILDEVLMVYLARARDRLSTFFNCTLPATTLNPFGARGPNIGPEMFVGRAAQIASLQRNDGATLVYGGRQLGKSSLLRQVQRAVHRPDSERYAIVRDLNVLDFSTSENALERIWTYAEDLLKEMGASLPRGEHLTTDRLEYLISTFRERPQARGLLLLDEADAFLSVDAMHGFRTVSALRYVMEQTQRGSDGFGFKVVLAGLQSVQQFSSVPNQPLQHLGKPEVIRPLTPAEAMTLVRKLELFGFELPQESVLRILSITNYHPALLQTFCQSLLNYLRTHRGRSQSREISLDDIDAVYGNRELRTEFRTLFTLTLRLEPMYAILTRAVILDQIDIRDSYSKTYSVTELRALGEQAWTEGFGSLSFDGMRACIEEMADLGVFAPSQDGRYRLRSPNVVRVLGSRDDIERDLVPQERRSRGPAFHLSGDRRARLGPDSAHFSPLTRAQASSLELDRSGVTLVIGSYLTGINHLGDALAFFGLAGARQRHIITLPLLTPESLEQAIRRSGRRSTSAETLIVFSTLAGTHDQLLRTIKLAQDSANVARIRNNAGETFPNVRIILSLTPTALPEWLRVKPKERDEIEGESGAVVLTTWSRSAVVDALSELNVDTSGPAVDRVMAVTGGLHALVSDVLQGVSSADIRSVSEVVAQMERDLGRPTSRLTERLLQERQFDDESPIRTAFLALTSLQVRSDESFTYEDVINCIIDSLASHSPSIHNSERIDITIVSLEVFYNLRYQGLLIETQGGRFLPINALARTFGHHR